MNLVFLGLSISSSWGNGHATTYRGLIRELTARGHDVLFLERDVPWYARSRDLPRPPYCRAELYADLDDLAARFTHDVRRADAVIVGSYVPEGVAAAEWVVKMVSSAAPVAFYDIDTPVTLAKLARGDEEYLSRSLVSRYDLYLSFCGGPTLERLQTEFGARRARPLYCAVDPDLYYPDTSAAPLWDLGYLGTYSDDRQPTLNALLLEPARHLPKGRFVVAGPQYPQTLCWPENVDRIEHLPPAEHRTFYTRQNCTLNVTRRDMIRAGYSPSVRLFEAAACAAPIISDEWAGLDEFFTPGREILLAHTPADVLSCLRDLPPGERCALGERARARVLAEHTAAHRAAQLESYLREGM